MISEHTGLATLTDIPEKEQHLVMGRVDVPAERGDDVILKDGSLPLTPLRELVMQYIERKRAA